MTQREEQTFNPWLFIPLLYFMQAIPVTVVQELSTIIYKDLGIANETITRYTSLIALPWGLQMLLGPFVDLNFTKRKWILAGQLAIAAGLVLAAFLLRTQNAFEFTLIVFGVTALFSALTNIATDGFALLSMTRTQQAAMAGFMSTFYRLGRLFCSALLVYFAGVLARGTRAPDPSAVGIAAPPTPEEMTSAWFVVLICGALIYALGRVINHFTVPRPEKDIERAPVPGETQRNLARTLTLVGIGLSGYFLLNSVVRLVAHGFWVAQGESLKGWQLPFPNLVLGAHFGVGSVETEVAQLLICLSVLLFSIGAWKKLVANSEFGEAMTSYIRQPGFGFIFLFILFYRFPEAMVGKITPLFLKDSVANGGMAISNEQLGILSGLLGVVGIILGGIVGGLTVSKLGLRKSFLPLALAMHVPNLLYLGLFYRWLPELTAGSLNMTVGITLFVDQFGYGFGFAGYMIYLMWVAQRGKYVTSHYAIGTGMGAVTIACAGILSGVLFSTFEKSLGYGAVFIGVLFLSIPGLLSLLFIPLDESHKQIKADLADA